MFRFIILVGISSFQDPYFLLASNLLNLCVIFKLLQGEVFYGMSASIASNTGAKGRYSASTPAFERCICRTKRLTKEFQKVNISLAESSFNSD